MSGTWKNQRQKLIENFVSFRPEKKTKLISNSENFWVDFEINIGMRPQPCSADNCQTQHNSNDWITKEIKKVITKRDKFFHLWVQAPSEIKSDLYRRQKK